MWRDPLVGLLLLSAALHGGVVWLAMLNFEEPIALPTQKGPVSIRLAPSLAAAPRPTPKEPEPRKEELLPAPQPEEALLPPPKRLEPQPEMLPLPIAIKATKPKVDERKPEVLPPPERIVEAPRPRPKKVEREPELLPPPMVVLEPNPKKEAKPEVVSPPKVTESSKPTPPSPASEESRGTQTEPISLSTNPAFGYPSEDLVAGREGIVYVRLRIDATGRVTSAVVENGTGTERMQEFAVATLLHWRFVPARQNGVAVPVERIKPVEFHIRRP
jgi:periplasmic protein TonB